MAPEEELGRSGAGSAQIYPPVVALALKFPSENLHVILDEALAPVEVGSTHIYQAVVALGLLGLPLENLFVVLAVEPAPVGVAPIQIDPRVKVLAPAAPVAEVAEAAEPLVAYSSRAQVIL